VTSSRGVRLVAGLGAVVLAAAVLLLARSGSLTVGGRRPVQATVSVTEALGGGDLSGFARARGPRPFSFPADHGPHPEFRTEWWYYTGNLGTAEGRRFGFQLTFFRTALAPHAAERGSRWAATHVYLAHFALTDVAGARFRAFSRTSRGALGLAGAQAEPFRVWLEDWVAEVDEPLQVQRGPGALPMRLRAAEGDVAIDLRLESAKPVVLQGVGGWSRKGPEPGNASYYYSLTRMHGRGAIRVGGEQFSVDGLAWMDREWSTSALGQDLAGWDWFALQLAGGRELMFYQLRRKDGTADRFSAGALIEVDGATRLLGLEDVKLEVLGSWVSPRSGVRYPAGWRLVLPAQGLVLEATPLLADQELIVGTRYWEGAVEVRGTDSGRSVDGRGYVELVGYGG
jgi:predicted secreted hydrolase